LTGRENIDCIEVGMSIKDEVGQLAQLFVSGGPGGEIGLPATLDRGKLDYSIDSLQQVDEYLAAVHAADPRSISDDEYGRTVLLAGAYLGEVVRRNSPRKYEWMTYDDFSKALPEVSRGLPNQENRQLVLCEPGGSAFTPVEDVMRSVAQGKSQLRAQIEAVFRAQKLLGSGNWKGGWV
jgi:hypothetical protein